MLKQIFITIISCFGFCNQLLAFSKDKNRKINLIEDFENSTNIELNYKNNLLKNESLFENIKKSGKIDTKHSDRPIDCVTGDL